MSLIAPDSARESPTAQLEQRVGGHRAQLELFVDRVRVRSTDFFGSREITLPLDTLSPHVVIRRRGPVGALLAGGALAVIALTMPGGGPPMALLAVILGVGIWFAGRHQYVVFPGQICDLELYRDRPDAAAARQFVAQIVRRIEALQQELRVIERQREGERRFDRVGELLAFRELYTEGIIDRSEFRLATEMLGRQRQDRIGFR